MKIEVLEGSSYPEPLVREWEELLIAARFRNPFLTPLWNEIWLRHFGKSIKAGVILFRDSGGALLAAGAFSNPAGGGSQKGLTLLGSTDVCDYRDIVIAPGKEAEVFSALGRFFGEGPWEHLELNGISEFSPTYQFLPPQMQPFGFGLVQEAEEVALSLDLPQTWEAFLEKLSGKDRHELRRKIRRLEREIAFETLRVEDDSSLHAGMGIFFDLHRKSRKDKAEFMTPEMEAYFREIAARFQERGWLSLSFLKLAGKEVATFFSFDFAGTEYVYNSGYDPDFARFSPGIVLAAYCIRQAIEKGMTGFNFLRGREDYKYHLGGREEKIYRLRVSKI
jgi:CelD/BcsL family acetyltransferase involved in cellulose biosynthesis